MAIFAFMIAWPLVNWVVAQEPKIEDRISEEIAARKDVWPIVQKLRILRKNESQLGEKHPRMVATRDQIAILEKQLSELIRAPAADNALSTRGQPSMIEDTSSIEKKHEMKGSDNSSIQSQTPTLSELEPSASLNAENSKNAQRTPADLKRFHELIFELDRKTWDTDYRFPKMQDGLAFELIDGNGNLSFKRLTHIGLFPALGIMWGIENDPLNTKSQVWQWYDAQDTQEKSLFIEVEGRICGFVLDPTFEWTGFAFLGLLGNKSSTEQDELLILRYQLDTLPPFKVVSRRPEIVLRSHCFRQEASLRLNKHQKGIDILGIHHKPEVFDSTVKLEPQGDSSYLLSSGNGGPKSSDKPEKKTDTSSSDNINSQKQSSGGSVPFLEHQSHFNKEANHSNLFLLNGRFVAKANEDGSVVENLALSNDELVGLTLGSNGDPVIFSSKSLFNIRSKQNLGIGYTLPSRLSATGWFSAIAKHKMAPGFISINSKQKPMEHDIYSQTWLRIPNDEQVLLSGINKIEYPLGTLFLQNLSTLNEFSTDRETRRETRGLMKTKNGWELFTYRWLDDQSDAELVDISTSSPSESDDGAWKIPSRRDCIACHQRLSSSMTIGFSLETLNERIEGPNGPITHYDLWKESGLISRENQYTIPVRPPNETRSPLARFDYPDKTAELRIDWDWFRESAVRDNLTHWLRAAPTSNGFFQVNLDDSWQPIDPKEGTVVSQARLIYVMAEGYRQTEDPQFLEAAIRGSDFLLSQFRDPKHGGYWWSTNPLGEVLDRTKSSYGQAFAIFALAHAHSVSGSKKYAEAALNAWRELLATMSDAWGGLYEKSDESFSNRRGKNQNPIMHTFEAGIALYDATGSSQVLDDLDSIAEFITTKLWREPGCIPEAFDENWSTPVSNSSGMWIVNGHQAEWAFLLSEGVRCGLSRRYLGFGNKLLDFNLQSGYDRDSGGLGEYDAPQKKGAWQQAEFLRAMLRYYSEHGREDLRLPIQLTYQLIKNNFADSKSGGWPIHDTKHKGNVWHCGSHAVLMYSEAIRISQNRNRSTQNRSQPKTRDAPNTTKVTQ